MLRAILRIQAVYYVLTGAWPIASMRTFELVTGPKTDDWLVRMVALATVAVGLALWGGARAERIPGAIAFLGAGMAASFATIDIVYALAGRIRPIYLLDAAAEVALVLLVLAGWLRARREPAGEGDN